MDQHGSKKWSLIASKLRTKSSKQCRRRWKNYLSINAKNCSWSAEEDAQLLAAHAELGNRWTEISKIFGDRTDNAVKNRYHALARKHPSLAAGQKRPRQASSDGSLSLGMDDQRRALRHSSGVREAVLQPPRSAATPVLPSPFEQMSAGGVHQQAAPHPAHAQPHAPLAIRVSREMLTPWEQHLAAQVNAMAAPVHIDVVSGPQPPFSHNAATYAAQPTQVQDPLVTRASWRQLLEGIGLETGGGGGASGSLGVEQNAVADFISWLSTSLPAPNLATPPPEHEEESVSKRVTRHVSREGGSQESLTEDHLGLLRRLVSRGVEQRGASLEISRLLSLDLEPVQRGGKEGAQHHRAHAMASSPRSDPLLRTRSSWKSRMGGSPEMSPGISFDFPRFGSGSNNPQVTRAYSLH